MQSLCNSALFRIFSRAERLEVADTDKQYLSDRHPLELFSSLVCEQFVFGMRNRIKIRESQTKTMK